MVLLPKSGAVFIGFIARGSEMLTFFTTAKPFRGHSGIIQCNAIKSWALLSADVEVILFGDDKGAAEAARALGIRHEPHVQRSGYGSKRLDYMFVTARDRPARDPLLRQLRHYFDGGFLPRA